MREPPYSQQKYNTISDNFFISSSGHKKISLRPQHANLLLSYEITPFSLINIDVGISGLTLRSRFNNHTDLIYKNKPAASTYSYDLDEQEKEQELNLNINYQRKFKENKDKILTFSYSINQNRSNNTLVNLLVKSHNFNGKNQKQFSLNKQLNNAVQIDYVYPRGNLKIESGLRFTHRDLSNDFSSIIINPSTGNIGVDTLNTGDMNYKLSVLRTYHSYLFKLAPFSFRAGVRDEYTFLQADFMTGAPIKQQYTNWLPSMKINYKVSNSICMRQYLNSMSSAQELRY
ncbi:outer membrane beta-barrel protein [Elizabethkingia argentiflava]|uniref:Outer membrane beta-barrel protein n=1 Tax=Elizabethkingia argenteiflava TaxID=2681556 RepID=A0A845PY68_9FLAO|nr:outer membrane beta-barrel protein [Elizabethkingia argenteiflava]